MLNYSMYIQTYQKVDFKIYWYFTDVQAVNHLTQIIYQLPRSIFYNVTITTNAMAWYIRNTNVSEQ